MAADQRKRRLNDTIIVGGSSQEHSRASKKRLGSTQSDLNISPHISLEWNESQKRVVAKREQICISKRDLAPFNKFFSHSRNILADVCAIPSEIFELDNLAEVLSYEVLQSRLSEKERNLLKQFLPKGIEAEQVVQSLLSGDNFHFGNPFLKWGASLCSGNLHPDSILQNEKCLNANKKAYYSELQKYHDDMLGDLRNLKETWESCKDPEMDFVQNIWRSRKLARKSFSSPSNGYKILNPEENLGATSESCSDATVEKACSSDNQNSSIARSGELPKRRYMEDKFEDSLVASDDVLKAVSRPRKVDKLNKRIVRNSDGAKYMSYVKISKKQFQLLKSMKQSGKSIQSRSLNRVLGDLDSFHVRPYEVFEEEERKKLHEHWLQVANRDLPAAFANWRRVQSHRCLITKSLGQEFKEKLKSLVEDEEKEYVDSGLQAEKNAGGADHESTLGDDVDFVHASTNSQPVEQIHSLNASPEVNTVDVEKEYADGGLQAGKNDGGEDHESTLEDDEDFVPASTNSQPVEQIHSLNASPEVNTVDALSENDYVINPMNVDSEINHIINRMDVDSENNHVILKTDNASSDLPDYIGNLNPVDVTVTQGVPLSSEDVWPAVSLPQAFYNPTSSHEYTSSSGLPLAHPQIMGENQACLIDLESNLREQDAGDNILCRQSNNERFSSYQNQERRELFQPFYQGQEILSYNHEEKQTGLLFHRTGEVLMGSDQFPGHFREQLQQPLPLEQRLKRQNDFYTRPNIQDTIYGDGGRYFIPKEHVSPMNVQDWAVNHVRMPALQSYLNGGEFSSPNWFSGQPQVHGGWSGLESAGLPNQSIANGSNNDESLFSVLSHCKELRSRTPYDAMASTEQFISPRNFGVTNGGIPRNSNMLPQTPNPLEYMNGCETSASQMTNNVGWVSLPHQSSALHDSAGRPFLRSWNQ